MPPLPSQPGAEFRHVPGWPGYAVTDTGEVWSCRRRRWNGFDTCWHRIKTHPDWFKRQVFTIRGGRGIQKQAKVHQVVMWAFVGPCPSGMEVAHNDGDPTNNRLDNLRYDTRRGNHMDTFKHGTAVRGETHGMSKLTEPMVKEIRARLAAGETPAALAREYCLSNTAVLSILHRRTWKHV
ncbi:MAG: HNH endonuclease [bacterium]